MTRPQLSHCDSVSGGKVPTMPQGDVAQKSFIKGVGSLLSCGYDAAGSYDLTGAMPLPLPDWHDELGLVTVRLGEA